MGLAKPMNIQDNDPDDWSEVPEEEEKPNRQIIKKTDPVAKWALILTLTLGFVWVCLRIAQHFVTQ